MSNEILLAELNAFRAIEGKDAFKDWRKARHMPMLEAYRADETLAKAKRVDDEIADAFEAPAEELAAQKGRESADIARDEALVEEVIKTKTIVKGAKGLPAGTYKVEVTEQKIEGNTLTTVAKVVGGVSYKEMARHEKSKVVKPFALIHTFLDANPTLGRKAAIAALVEQGVNFYTARTQYQRWFSKQKGE